MDPVAAAQEFFKADTFVDVVATCEALQQSCGAQGHGRAAYEAVKAKTAHHHQCKSLWDILDKKRNSCSTYLEEGCRGLEVLVVGAGPAGLVSAIELTLMGASVRVVEKRPYLTRNNVLHLWQCTVQEGIELGLKFFFKKFCAGGMDHISIRRLQIILAKVLVVLGGRLLLGVAFEGFVPPAALPSTEHNSEDQPTSPLHEPGPRDPPHLHGGGDAGEQEGGARWSARLRYDGGHPELRGRRAPDVRGVRAHAVVGADGEQSRVAELAGFETQLFQGPRAMGVTFNFQNRGTPQEAGLREFGLIRYAAPKFFGGLAENHGIRLESCTYYRDETHYFVMATSKDCLLELGVLKENHSDVRDLLAKSNINQNAFEKFAVDVARACELPPNLPFALDRYNQPDMGIFDFTKKKSIINPMKVFDLDGARLLVTMVGDALIAPFWPQGTGSNRCFLGARDVAWSIYSYAQVPRFKPSQSATCSDAQKAAILKIIQDHQIAFKLLQESPESLNVKGKPFNLCNPNTRYTRFPKDTSDQVLDEKIRAMWVCCGEEGVPKYTDTPTSAAVSAIASAPEVDDSRDALASSAVEGGELSKNIETLTTPIVVASEVEPGHEGCKHIHHLDAPERDVDIRNDSDDDANGDGADLLEDHSSTEEVGEQKAELDEHCATREQDMAANETRGLHMEALVQGSPQVDEAAVDSTHLGDAHSPESVETARPTLDGSTETAGNQTQSVGVGVQELDSGSEVDVLELPELQDAEEDDLDVDALLEEEFEEQQAREREPQGPKMDPMEDVTVQKQATASPACIEPQLFLESKASHASDGESDDVDELCLSDDGELDLPGMDSDPEDGPCEAAEGDMPHQVTPNQTSPQGRVCEFSAGTTSAGTVEEGEAEEDPCLRRDNSERACSRDGASGLEGASVTDQVETLEDDVSFCSVDGNEGQGQDEAGGDEVLGLQEVCSTPRADANEPPVASPLHPGHASSLSDPEADTLWVAAKESVEAVSSEPSPQGSRGSSPDKELGSGVAGGLSSSGSGVWEELTQPEPSAVPDARHSGGCVAESIISDEDFPVEEIEEVEFDMNELEECSMQPAGLARPDLEAAVTPGSNTTTEIGLEGEHETSLSKELAEKIARLAQREAEETRLSQEFVEEKLRLQRVEMQRLADSVDAEGESDSGSPKVEEGETSPAWMTKEEVLDVIGATDLSEGEIDTLLNEEAIDNYGDHGRDVDADVDELDESAHSEMQEAETVFSPRRAQAFLDELAADITPRHSVNTPGAKESTSIDAGVVDSVSALALLDQDSAGGTHVASRTGKPGLELPNKEAVCMSQNARSRSGAREDYLQALADAESVVSQLSSHELKEAEAIDSPNTMLVQSRAGEATSPNVMQDMKSNIEPTGDTTPVVVIGEPKDPGAGGMSPQEGERSPAWMNDEEVLELAGAEMSEDEMDKLLSEEMDAHFSREHMQKQEPMDAPACEGQATMSGQSVVIGSTSPEEARPNMLSDCIGETFCANGEAPPEFVEDVNLADGVPGDGPTRSAEQEVEDENRLKEMTTVEPHVQNEESCNQLADAPAVVREDADTAETDVGSVFTPEPCLEDEELVVRTASGVYTPRSSRAYLDELAADVTPRHTTMPENKIAEDMPTDKGDLNQQKDGMSDHNMDDLLGEGTASKCKLELSPHADGTSVVSSAHVDPLEVMNQDSGIESSLTSVPVQQIEAVLPRLTARETTGEQATSETLADVASCASASTEAENQDSEDEMDVTQVIKLFPDNRSTTTATKTRRAERFSQNTSHGSQPDGSEGLTLDDAAREAAAVRASMQREQQELAEVLRRDEQKRAERERESREALMCAARAEAVARTTRLAREAEVSRAGAERERAAMLAANQEVLGPAASAKLAQMTRQEAEDAAWRRERAARRARLEQQDAEDARSLQELKAESERAKQEAGAAAGDGGVPQRADSEANSVADAGGFSYLTRPSGTAFGAGLAESLQAELAVRKEQHLERAMQWRREAAREGTAQGAGRREAVEAGPGSVSSHASGDGFVDAEAGRRERLGKERAQARRDEWEHLRRAQDAANQARQQRALAAKLDRKQQLWAALQQEQDMDLALARERQAGASEADLRSRFLADKTRIQAESKEWEQEMRRSRAALQSEQEGWRSQRDDERDAHNAAAAELQARELEEAKERFRQKQLELDEEDEEMKTARAAQLQVDQEHRKNRMLKSFQDEQMLHQMVTSEEEERCSQVQASKLDTSFMSSVRTSASHVNTSFMRMGSVVSLSQHRASGSERRSTEDPERLRRKRERAERRVRKEERRRMREYKEQNRDESFMKHARMSAEEAFDRVFQEERHLERQRIVAEESKRLKARSCKFCGVAITSQFMMAMECPSGPWYHPYGIDKSTMTVSHRSFIEPRLACCGRTRAAGSGCRQMSHQFGDGTQSVAQDGVQNGDDIRSSTCSYDTVKIRTSHGSWAGRPVLA